MKPKRQSIGLFDSRQRGVELQHLYESRLTGVIKCGRQTLSRIVRRVDVGVVVTQVERDDLVDQIDARVPLGVIDDVGRADDEKLIAGATISLATDFSRGAEGNDRPALSSPGGMLVESWR